LIKGKTTYPSSFNASLPLIVYDGTEQRDLQEDRAFEALATVSVGLVQAIDTLKALQSETSDFPVNLPVSDLGQPVLHLATEPEPA
jgi:hypothetical protein